MAHVFFYCTGTLGTVLLGTSLWVRSEICSITSSGHPTERRPSALLHSELRRVKIAALRLYQPYQSFLRETNDTVTDTLRHTSIRNIYLTVRNNWGSRHATITQRRCRNNIETDKDAFFRRTHPPGPNLTSSLFLHLIHININIQLL